MPPYTPCPDIPSLQQLLQGLASLADREPLFQHLSECDRCAEYARTFLTEDAVAAAVRGAAAGDAPEDPSVAGLAAQLMQHGPPAAEDDVKLTVLSDTIAPFGEPVEEADEWDFLAPAEGPDEIGRLGGYRIVRVLGSGGMGVVFHAEDDALQRPVALKAMRPALANGASARRRFLREGRAAAALHHDHIVPVFQVGQDRGVPFLVMPLLRGESLEDRLRREGALPPAEVCRIGQETARGLEVAHARGLVHRDIKPANIWLESEAEDAVSNGRVKILDFGLARPADAAGLTLEGAVVGTPAYMAPEQAGGRAVDARTDLFALGCVLYHTATGAPPFRGADAVATLVAVASDRPRPPAEVNPAVPPALSALVMRLLAKDPAERPASARAVANALGGAETAAPRRGRLSWRPWALCGLIALLLLGAAAATAALVIVQTDRGEVSIDTDDPDVEIVAKGERIVRIVDPKTGRSYQLDRDDLTLTRADDPDGLAVTLDGDKPVVLKRNGRKMATLRLAAKPGDAAGETAGFREVHGVTDSAFVAWADGQAKDGFRVTSLSACAGAPSPRFNGIAVRDSPPPLTSVRVGMSDGESLNYFQAMSGQGYRLLSDAVYNDGGERKQAEIWVRDGVAFGGYGTTLGALSLFLDAAARAKGLMPVSISTELGTRDLSVTTCLVLAPARGVRWETAAGLSADALRQRADACRARGWRLTHVAAYLDGTAERFLAVVAENPDGIEWQCRADLTEADYGQAIHELGGRGLRPAATASYRHGDEVRYAALWEGRPAREKDVNEIRSFAGHRGPVRSVAFSPDGRYALSASGYPDGDNTARLWDVATGEEIRRFEGHTAPVEVAAFTPDGKRVLTAAKDRTIRLWDATTGKERRRLDLTDTWAMSLAVSLDGRRFLGGCGDHLVRLWDLEDWKEIGRFTGHAHWVTAVAFSPDGRRGLSADWDGAIRLWDLERRSELRRFTGHERMVWAVAFLPGNGRFLSAGDDGTLRLWDAEKGEELRRLEGHAMPVYGLALSADGRRALSSGGDGTIRLWDVDGGRELTCFRGRPEAVWSVAFSPDERLALSGGGGVLRGGEWTAGGDWDLHLWRLPAPEPDPKGAPAKPPPKDPDEVRLFEGHTEWVLNARFHPDGRRVFSASCDGTVRLWDQETGQTVRIFGRLPGNVRGLALTADGKTVAGGSANLPAGASNFIRLWDVETGTKVRDIPVTTGILSVDLSPDGRRLLAGGEDGVGRVFDVGSGEEVCRFEEHTGNIHTAIFSKDGRHAFTGSRDQSIRMWDARTGDQVRRFIGHTGWVLALALSPDGHYLLSGGDKTVRLWEVDTAHPVHCYEGHPGYVLSVAFSPDGRRILSGDFDDRLRLWDKETGRVLLDRTLGGTVEVVRFSSDGRRALFGGNDNLLRLWRLPDPPAAPDG